jgi:glucokinase
MFKNSVIGVDFDGVKVRVGRVKNNEIVKFHSDDISFKESEDYIINEIVTSIKKQFTRDTVGIGIGVPSLVDIEKGVVYLVKNVPSWKEVQLKEKLEQHFHVPVYVNNDANCFAAGVKYFGKGKDYKNMVGIVVGTGFGAGVISEGRLVSGVNGGAGEFGKIPYERHDYEYYCSAKYFVKEYKTDFEQLYKRAQKNDKTAKAIFKQFGHHLGNAIITIVKVFDPEIIIMGGPLSKAFLYFSDSMWRRIRSFPYKTVVSRLSIEVTDQPNIAIMGAAALYYEVTQSVAIEELRLRQKETEKSLREEQEFLHILMDNIPDTIYIKDTKSRFLRINKAQADILGIKDPKKAIGKTDYDFFDREHAKQAYKDEQNIIKTGMPVLGLVEKAIDRRGNLKWFSTTKIPFYDEQGRIKGIAGISRDITKRKKMEDELLYERYLLNSIINSIPDLIYVKDRKSRLIKLNMAYVKRMGVKTPEDLLGKTDFDLFSDEHAQQAYDDEQKIMETGKPLLNYIEKETWENAPDTWASSSKMPFQDINGKIIGIIGISKDVTKIKEAEIALKESKKNLEQAKKETDYIMENVDEGLFLLNKNLEIGSQYSKALEDVFNEKNLAKKSLLDLLSSKLTDSDLRSADRYLNLMFKEDVEEDMLNNLNPLTGVQLNFEKSTNLLASSKHLIFKFRRIKSKSGKIVSLIGIARDITNEITLEQRLKESEEQTERQMKWLLSLLHVEPALLLEFIAGVEKELEFIEKIFREEGESKDYKSILERVFRSMHLIKGNASFLELKFFIEQAHRFEDKISEIQKKDEIRSTDFVPLVLQLRDMRRNLEEVNQLIERISRIHKQMRPKRDYEHKLFIQSLQNLVNQLCEDAGKEVKFIHDQFKGNIIPYQYQLLVKDILIQLIRNSISHGIETPEEREQLKKDRCGTIIISNFQQDSKFGFCLKDDGRGLQLSKLREKLKTLGKWDPDQIDRWDDDKVRHSIFFPGISVSQNINMISGRGVGMDVVKSKVDTHKGEIVVNSAEGEYCEFIITIPQKKREAKNKNE